MKKRIVALFLAVACLCSLVGCRTRNLNTPTVSGDYAAYAVVQASYPEMAQYPNEMAYVDQKTGDFDSEGFEKVYGAWRDSQAAQRNQPEGYADGLKPYFRKSMSQFLSNAQGENRIISPLNVYMALAMLAETADGNSRQQILELLGADNIEALRTQAKSVWNANYCNDGAVTSVLASSLWLNETVKFNQDTLNTLAETYYASTFSGSMGSPELNKALQDWLNTQTGGLLEQQASGIELDPQTVMALAATIYFRAKWAAEFSEENTAPEIFHGENGDVSCDFLHQSTERTYYWSDQFAAVGLSMEGSGQMWLILPDEGVSVDDLLSDSKTMDFLDTQFDWPNQKRIIVNLSMPKFDVASDFDLIPGLRALGITDVFDGAVSDFTPLTTDAQQLFLDQATHAARVIVDEEGVEAAAYTVMMVCGAAMPPDEEVDFVLDRPFLFAITGQDGLPLFAGVVNRPA